MARMERAARKSLLVFSRWLAGFCRAFWRRPRLVVALMVIVSVLTFSSLGKLRFLFSAEDMVGDGLASADELASIKERYSDGTSSILLVRPPAGELSLGVPELCALRRWYSSTRIMYPGLKNSTSTFDAIKPARVEKDRVRYLNLLQLDCQSEPPRAMVELAQAKRELDESPWVALRDNSGQLSLLFVFTFRKAEDPKFGSFNPAVVKELHASAEAELRQVAPRARHEWVGSADFQHYVKKGFQFSHVVNTGMVLFLLFAFRFCYGTWLSGILYCSTLVLTTIWIFGTKALMGSSFDVLSSGVFLILGVSALEDFTFLSAEQLKGKPWRKTIRGLIVPSFFTSLTTIVGFGSLCMSDLAIIRRFGAWCAWGTLIEWLMLFAILPAVLPFFHRKATWVNPARARLTELTESLSVKAIPRWAARCSLVVFPLTIVAFMHLNANDTPAAIFPSGHPYNGGLSTLLQSKGWQGTVSLLSDLPGPPSETAPALEAAANRLKSDPRLNGSISDFETAARGEKWLGRESILPDYLVPIHFRRSLQYEQLVDQQERPRATLYIRDVSAQDLQLLKRAAADACPKGECHLGGDLIAYADFSTYVPETLLESIAVSVLLVAAIVGFLACALGKLALLPHLLASAFWGPCLMICVLSALGTPMDFLKCIFASVLVGLTGDNGIQYLFASRNKPLSDGIEHRGGASIHTNVMMGMTALFYLASYFGPPKTFGLILASGLLATLIGDLWLLNGYLSLTPSRRRKIPFRPAPVSPTRDRPPEAHPAPL